MVASNDIIDYPGAEQIQQLAASLGSSDISGGRSKARAGEADMIDVSLINVSNCPVRSVSVRRVQMFAPDEV